MSRQNTVTVLSSTGQANLDMAVTSEPIRYDGFYGLSDGLGSIQVIYDNFAGNVVLEATLALSPGDSDFFPISPLDDTLLNFTSDGNVSTAVADWSAGRRVITPDNPLNGSEVYPIRGNYTFVRVTVDQTGLPANANTSYGQVQRVLLSN